MKRLLRTLEEGRAVVGGVLSGTSGDGIDVALCSMEVEPLGGDRFGVQACEALAFETRPFPGELAGPVREVLDGAPSTLGELARLSGSLGTAFGSAIREVGLAAGLTPDLIGSHGLTVFHHDGQPAGGTGTPGSAMDRVTPQIASDRATLQIGDGDHVAEAAGCTVVSDFRQRDVAAGGEGAPISILADDVIFRAAARPTAILNLGGMANLSWLPGEGPVLAFDTGPAGSLLDGLARRLLGQECDLDGEVARQGQVQGARLERWLEHPFFVASPPKSTGRDTFGEAWVQSLLGTGELRESAADLLATAVELVAATVALGLEQLPAAPRELHLAGGGIHNRALLSALERRCGLPIRSSNEVGVDPDAREALVFAVLAARCLLGEAVTKPSATGARAGRILGKISPHGR